MSAACKDEWPIHREAPTFAEQSVEQEILITGIKVRAVWPHDLNNPPCKGMRASYGCCVRMLKMTLPRHVAACLLVLPDQPY